MNPLRASSHVLEHDFSLSASAAELDSLAAWRERPRIQQPTWPDEDARATVAERLRQAPPLVFAGEVDQLADRVASAARGEAFVLMGGDCAETFADSTADRIRNKIRTILQMSAVLTYGASMPVVKMGRMAGQFAKPRSGDTETRDGVTLPSYRGDGVNGFEFTEASRLPDPERLWRMYTTSASTLNLMRAFTTGGFADLREVHAWNQGFIAGPEYARYESLARDIDRAVRFMAACGYDFEALRSVEFYAAHEGLLLDYEEALSRIDSRTGQVYDCSGHFLWIGERTRQLDGAHVEFLAKVSNPIGVKLGPTATVEDALALIDVLDPERRPGRLTFITRMGADRIRDALPPLVEGVRDAGAEVAWVTDPMHGNTITSSNGYKTRRFEDILDEVVGFFEVHEGLGTIPAGLHMELTGDDVTEVLGGVGEIDEIGLERRYETLVDPRLNHRQSLELAFLVAERLSRRA
ncbi:2-keto-3-deoxy-D-arabino-heptulosonate-7-phosphate synthase II [Brachybacterium nesterenkovii]|uniref:Phospho-2-dehydro-3-deoxyheptonate aldolase n=1 Tax=Brachybacterium nesterenkovii TaxID=47847 RepID=A0A1X6WVE6_9MICO|nr:3-deoxy-7-phosphoheptulonate synthase class II [Brachybacterium nesterenkovii]SLM89399.1 2-keto-3-deoxy-D-arabino-heptulosonate-7-phosphate synthase II [Brachybacterium nesterenkovii]